MFWKKEKEQKKHTDFEITSENLAVPEIHIGKRRAEKAEGQQEEHHHESILYDDVAVPEIHIPARKKR